MDDKALDLVKVHGVGGYDSDFSEDESQGEKIRYEQKRFRKDDPLLQKAFQREKHAKLAHRNVAAQEWDREEARNRRHHLISMNAYDRHKKFVNDYILYYGGKKEDFKRSTANDKMDVDVLRENHRFLWREEDEEDMTWEKELAKKYYDKLFKEYCIADLSRYKENKFGFRWRVETEVISGKAKYRKASLNLCTEANVFISVSSKILKEQRQFFCGNKRCEKKEGLKSWEVNFAYVEHGEKRNALVKLRLCPECSYRLNYHHRRKEVKAKKRQQTKDNEEEPQLKKAKSSLSRKHRHKKKKEKHSSRSPQDSSKSGEGSEGSDGEEGPSDGDYWKGPAPSMEEKSREEEFDEYFQDMFL